MGHGSDYAADCRHRLTAGWRQCRGDCHGLPQLPPQKRTKAIIIGTVGAILARVLLLAIALYLLSLPWLKIVGALLLLWIGIAGQE